LNRLIQMSGEQPDDKDAKVATAANLWVPAANNDRRFGRWRFIEIKDRHEVMKEIRAKYCSDLNVRAA